MTSLVNSRGFAGETEISVRISEAMENIFGIEQARGRALREQIETLKPVLRSARSAITSRMIDAITRGEAPGFATMRADNMWRQTLEVFERLYSKEAVREACRALSIDSR